MMKKMDKDLRSFIIGISLLLILSGVIFFSRNIILEGLASGPPPLTYEEYIHSISEFLPGDKVFFNGLEGTIIKECWFTIENYKIRLLDGRITYARGKELRLK